MFLLRSLALAAALVASPGPDAGPPPQETARAVAETPPPVAEGGLDWSRGVRVDPDVRLTQDWGGAPTGVF